jgi:hypothetical protein
MTATGHGGGRGGPPYGAARWLWGDDGGGVWDDGVSLPGLLNDTVVPVGAHAVAAAKALPRRGTSPRCPHVGLP